MVTVRSAKTINNNIMNHSRTQTYYLILYLKFLNAA
jgi:hypothetical protein